ncbi:DUF4270 domain-containing protein [Flavobacterium chuncheonense]|uniref:DUF4270 domain-containing protein n=1 Tax=Flavobacterium chuncheonense TaxID=2026653 RepID=A0ABW5YMZ0_9FLAO
MKKIFLSLVVIAAVFTVSCDRDFNTLGSDIVGDGHYEFDRYEVQNLSAYTVKTGAVQSNNLVINSLGVYSDPAFGETISSFVTQLELPISNPDFGIDVTFDSVNDSVYLYVPYFSRQTATGLGIEANTYELDSIYGDLNGSFDLKIYENGYYLSDFDSQDPTVRQRYYSNQKGLISSSIQGGLLNNSSNTAENTQFKFSKEEIIIYETDGEGNYVDAEGNVVLDNTQRVIKERLAPGMWINLDKATFQTKIIQASSSNLINNNVFKEYFKGLFFDVASNGGSSPLAQLDFSKGYVAIQYHSKNEIGGESRKNIIKLNLKGNTVNFFENSFSQDYQSVLDLPFGVNQDFLHVKGGNGSVALIDLFGPVNPETNVPFELEELRSNNWLINEALLIFSIKNNGQKNPKRIFVYDADNNAVLLDYIYDGTTATDSKNNKYIHDGFLKVNSNGEALQFVVRIKNHIDKIVNNDDVLSNKNVRLGVSVTENINISALANVFEVDPLNGLEKLPAASVMNPLGTVLYGNTSAIADDKKMKLEIYYTKPN